MKILIINGPNLNMLGRREPEIYGDTTFEQYLASLRTELGDMMTIDHFQSNIEGELIDALQRADGHYDAVLLNGGGYTHTSVALRDAVAAIATPVIEIHISQPAAREEFRHVSLLAAVCKGSISGFGLASYRLGALAVFSGNTPK
ncbi:MAG: type II 3-dehydroquinate dehydratase [Rikenellaceae bacterium]|nr:type II 3-dehydroquinate dehydratase [Rikenellaceae bacterium]MCL2692920.1 type II 3-dehydroquinate dehydratase [Rikenellaceae bacterium]